MNYLRHEWENYRYRDWALLLVLLSVIEDGLRCLRVPWQVLRPIFWVRGRLTEGKTRRMLRRVVRHWAKRGIHETQYFDFGDKALSVRFEWQDIRVMKGYQNDVY